MWYKRQVLGLARETAAGPLKASFPPRTRPVNLPALVVTWRSLDVYVLHTWSMYGAK